MSSSCSDVNIDDDLGLFISHFRRANTVINNFFTRYHYLMTWRYLKDIFPIANKVLLTFPGNYLKYSNAIRTNDVNQSPSIIEPINIDVSVDFGQRKKNRL